MADQKIKVRKGEPKDVVNICKLLTAEWHRQTIEYAPVDDLRSYKWILAIIEDGFLAVADLNGRIVGAACASPFRPPWSRQWMLDMEFMYVLSNFRSSGVTDELLRAVEGFADKVELSMTFTIATGEKAKVKDRYMRQQSWQYVGGNHLRPYDGRKQEENEEDL